MSILLGIKRKPKTWPSLLQLDNLFSWIFSLGFLVSKWKASLKVKNGTKKEKEKKLPQRENFTYTPTYRDYIKEHFKVTCDIWEILRCTRWQRLFCSSCFLWFMSRRCAPAVNSHTVASHQIRVKTPFVLLFFFVSQFSLNKLAS